MKIEAQIEIRVKVEVRAQVEARVQHQGVELDLEVDHHREAITQ